MKKEIISTEKISKLLRESKEDDGTFFDSLYNLGFFISLAKSADDINNGRVYTLEEVKKEMEAKFASDYNKLSKRVSL